MVGLIVKKTPPAAAKGAMLIGLPLYGFCRFAKFFWNIPALENFAPNIKNAIIAFNSWAFLHHMGLVFAILVISMLIVTKLKPLTEPVKMPVSANIDTPVHPKTYVFGCIIIAMTVTLYVIFR